MALSKHTAAGAQGKGDPSSWGRAQGGTGDSGERREGGGGWCGGGKGTGRGGVGGAAATSGPCSSSVPPFPASTITDSRLHCVFGGGFVVVGSFFFLEQSSDFVPERTIGGINQHNSCLKTIQVK